MELLDFTEQLDPFRNVTNVLRKKNIVPVDAKTKLFQCSGCQESKISGWEYQDTNGKWHDLNYVDRCLDCQNGRMSKETRKEIEQKRIQKMMDEYWYVDPDLEDAGFKNFQEIDNATINAKNTCIGFTQEASQMNFKNMKPLNLVLMGTPGTGKSHLATAIARTLKARGLSVGFIPTEVLINMMKDSFQDKHLKQEHRILEEIKEFDVMVLDDLGVENYKMDAVSFITTKLLSIVNARKGKPTIYTTNLNSSKLPIAIGDRTYSRLQSNTKFVDLYTNDYRETLKG